MTIIDDMPLGMIVLFCVTLGLAPFTPPHIWEKLVMLFSGNLREPVDMFDMLLHGAPWIVLIIKLLRMMGPGAADPQ